MKESPHQVKMFLSFAPKEMREIKVVMKKLGFKTVPAYLLYLLYRLTPKLEAAVLTRIGNKSFRTWPGIPLRIRKARKSK